LRAGASRSTRDARYAFAIERAPPGLPRGARAVRWSLAVRSPAFVRVCAPGDEMLGRVMGGCETRRVPRHTDVEGSAYAFVPDGAGTWTIELDGADHTALRAFFASPAPVPSPPAWSDQARALGVKHVGASKLWWAETRGDKAEYTIEVEGRAP
jgi:hypothetical protein